MDETCSFCSLNCGEFYLSVSTAEAFKAAEARDAGALSDRFSQQIRCNDSSLPSFTSWVVQTCAKGDAECVQLLDETHRLFAQLMLMHMPTGGSC